MRGEQTYLFTIYINVNSKLGRQLTKALLYKGYFSLFWRMVINKLNLNQG